MASGLILRARIRKRDKDIRQAVERLNLEEGEMADMVRDGFRKVLAEMGALGVKSLPAESFTPDTARIVARELMRNIETQKSPNIPIRTSELSQKPKQPSI